MSYQVGDIIKTVRTLRVERVTSTGGLMLDDVQNGDAFYHNPNRNNGSLKIEMVKKAAPKRKKPELGAHVLGRDVKQIMWKRGTILCAQHSHAPIVLSGEGTWHLVDDPRLSYEFDDLYDDAKFEVKYLP